MKILLNVCGSISAYKALDIARGLVKRNHQVKVILSAGALEFVVPNAFKYLGVEEVFEPLDDFKSQGVLHINLAKWCDKFIVAPLSANTLSKMANGQANDLMLSTFLALSENTPVLLFPAMNERMLYNPLVQENFSKLQMLFPNLMVCPTGQGELACGDVGYGKLLDVSSIIEIIPHVSPQKTKSHFLITTGATLAPLDPVRYLTNSSSGITGYHLALQAISLGHRVTLIAGKNATEKLNYLQGLPHYQLIRATTTRDFQKIVMANFHEADYYISSAALGDIEFNCSENKIKKNSLGDHINILKSPDILKETLSIRRPEQKIVGFAAEVNLTDETLFRKWKDKPVDLLIGTKVHNGIGNEIQGFSNEKAYYKFLTEGQIIFEGELSKEELAIEIIKKVSN